MKSKYEGKEFIFNKNRKVSECWKGGEQAEFRSWHLKAENYLHSGHDAIKGLLKWASEQTSKIDLKKMKEEKTKMS